MPEQINKLFKLFSTLLLLVVIISVVVPFAPKMPAPGLDPSWALALNQAVAQGLSFGKEIIFTLGPYSSIYTKSYHPATDFMMIAGSLYLAISYWIALIYLMSNVRWYWFLIYCVPLFVMVYARDSLFFSYPLLIGLFSFKIISSDPRLMPTNNYFLLLVFFLFAPLGLFSLIKGSMLILCMATNFLCFLFFLVNKRVTLALICIAAPISSLILFWLVAGQSITYLPDYLLNSFYIASYFSEAMSSDGSVNEIILYLLTTLLIFIVISYHKQTSAIDKLFLLSIYFVFMFVSFKTGFTRHFGHTFIPGTSILLATIFLPFIYHKVSTYLLILISLYCWNYINGHYTKISFRDNFISSYSSALHGIKSRIQDPYWLEKNFTFTMNYLRLQGNFPSMQGTTDIYSYNQSYLISSQNTWSPRPVFQSYSVFSPKFAEANTTHLQEKNSPDNIIFKIEPIDGRVPSLEDGASWPLLMTNYQPIQLRNEFLILRKKTNFSRVSKHLLRSDHYILGESVDLSEQRQPIFAEIIIKPTLLGKLATFFFKPERLEITFNLKNGTTKQYRLIASMAKSTFLLSPLIENTTEFSLLHKKNDDLNDKLVESFTINTNTNGIWHWKSLYTIKFIQII